MFSSHRNAASSYRNVGLETSVAQADPHTLIAMLYDGSLAAIGQARAALLNGDLASKGEATGRAVRILEEGLKAALDSRGGELTANLRALYEYMTARLLSANLSSDDSRYAEVAAMIAQLRDAWQGIAAQVRAGQAQVGHIQAEQAQVGQVKAGHSGVGHMRGGSAGAGHLPGASLLAGQTRRAAVAA
ncbi:MAG: flagellar export chaperone FliS [Gammaproteobacteria bacterium]